MHKDTLLFVNQFTLSGLLNLCCTSIRTRRTDATSPCLAKFVRALIEVCADNIGDVLQGVTMLPKRIENNYCHEIKS